MRECSSTECDIIKVLKQGSALFVDKNEEEDGFYKVLDIDSNEEGYVSKKYITFQKKKKVLKFNYGILLVKSVFVQ